MCSRHSWSRAGDGLEPVPNYLWFMPTRSNITLEARKRALAKRILESNDERVIADLEHLTGGAEQFVLSAAQKKELDASLDRYLRGESTTYMWEQVREHVRAQLNKG